MSVEMQISNDLCLINLNKCHINLADSDVRRFMYHPDGWLILGRSEKLGLYLSHSEEFFKAEQQIDMQLPPFDDFVRGWIAGPSWRPQCPFGVVSFLPEIPSNHIEMFEKGFSFVEAVLENGLSKKTLLRGFSGTREQTIGEMLGEERSLDEQIKSAKQQALKQDVVSCNQVEKIL